MSACHQKSALVPMENNIDYECAECGQRFRLISAYDFTDLLKWMSNVNGHLEKIQSYLESGNLVLAFQEVAWAKEELDWPSSFEEMVMTYLDLKENDEKWNEREESPKV